MTANRIRLLQVEDSESDAELIVRYLEKAEYEVVAKRVQSAGEMRAALAESAWDLIISDYRMPGFDAPAALAVLRETAQDIPFLVISGMIGEDVAVGMMKAGAHDYLMKGSLIRLPAAVERELRDAGIRAENRQALQKLQESEAQLTLTLQSTDTGIFDYYPQTGKIFYSDLTRWHLQLPAETEPTLENFFEGLHVEDRARVQRSVSKVFLPESGGHYAEEYRTGRLLNGEDHWISACGRVLYDTQGQAVRFLGVTRDITERKGAERALQFQLRLTACITEQSTDCILLTDHNGVVRFVNPEMERVFGFSFEEFQAKSTHDLLHHHYPDGRPYPANECKLARHMDSGEMPRDSEEVLFHKDGTPIDVSLSCAPLDLNGERIGVVFTYRDITDLKRSECALRQSNERFRRLFEADVSGIMICDGERVLEANDHFLRILGYSREQFATEPISWRGCTPPEYGEAMDRALHSLVTTGTCQAIEKECIRKDGTRVPVLFTAVEVGEPGEPRFLCFVVDLSERKSLENQFRQAQKLESIGLLAGGVAHDFNNLLTIILGYANLLEDALTEEHPLSNAARQISEAGEKAAGLTRQLLTFSRRNTGAPAPIMLDGLVAGILEMLQRLIGERVQVILSPGAGKGFIHADPVLIEQVILNLAVNARDAMPEGGELFIETSSVAVQDEFAARSFGVEKGTYVSLCVTDTGTGMSPEVQAHLFEPFFTTKEPGKGTGLGLSTVYGIVKQSNGSITVHSSPGLGTSFRILFPAMLESKQPGRNELVEIQSSSAETVLVVEDETGVRQFVCETLEASGYHALEARCGDDAVAIATAYKGKIDLLLTDVVLPGMNGAEVIRQFLALYPDTPVLRVSGYPERYGSVMGDGIPHLQKPFTKETLLTRIRTILRDVEAKNASVTREPFT